MSPTRSDQRGDTEGVSPPPSRGMALLPFGGSKIALKSSTRIVIPSTTNALTTGLRPRKPIQPFGISLGYQINHLPSSEPALIKTFNRPRSEV
jgi:hypothetical protein